MRVFLPSKDDILDLQDSWMLQDTIRQYLEDNEDEMNEMELEFHSEEYSMATLAFLFRMHSMRPFWMSLDKWAKYLEPKIGWK